MAEHNTHHYSDLHYLIQFTFNQFLHFNQLEWINNDQCWMEKDISFQEMYHFQSAIYKALYIKRFYSITVFTVYHTYQRQFIQSKLNGQSW